MRISRFGNSPDFVSQCGCSYELEFFDLGNDPGSSISTDCDGPFNFTGKIDTVKIEPVK